MAAGIPRRLPECDKLGHRPQTAYDRPRNKRLAYDEHASLPAIVDAFAIFLSIHQAEGDEVAVSGRIDTNAMLCNIEQVGEMERDHPSCSCPSICRCS